MKKWISMLLAAVLISCPLAVSAASLPITDASKWTPSFTGERAYKTPDQSVKKVNDGIEFTGVGGDRENYTYGFSEAINFPKEDLTIESTIKEGTEDEMLFAFALMGSAELGLLVWKQRQQRNDFYRPAERCHQFPYGARAGLAVRGHAQLAGEE